ncbi:MAG: phospholipase, partial [Xanthomonadaceae bacterium]|nr:phospholipase [Xanthomonadaceae bacterium]
MPRAQIIRKTFLAASIAAAGFTLLAFAQSAPNHDDQTSGPVRPISPGHGIGFRSPQDAVPTATPIKHLVVIFDENRSFDHYFGTYPDATNPRGEPAFHAASWTPAVDGLTPTLLTHNPNTQNPVNGVDGVNPFRLDRTQANTEGQ